jgi:phenylpyruvate tautomerase PptA (4-oxalocrotonate tautomerase family)
MPFAMLVRPDGRIAWVEREDTKDRKAALADAIAQVTGWKLPESIG